MNVFDAARGLRNHQAISARAVDRGVIEFDALPDSDRPGATDDDFFCIFKKDFTTGADGTLTSFANFVAIFRTKEIRVVVVVFTNGVSVLFLSYTGVPRLRKVPASIAVASAC